MKNLRAKWASEIRGETRGVKSGGEIREAKPGDITREIGHGLNEESKACVFANFPDSLVQGGVTVNRSRAQEGFHPIGGVSQIPHSSVASTASKRIFISLCFLHHRSAGFIWYIYNVYNISPIYSNPWKTSAVNSRAPNLWQQ
jgi:hypothetical protein